MDIRAFQALRPTAEYADSVACVPYDTIDEAEAREHVRRKPSSFLRVVRPEVNLPEGEPGDSAAAYQRAAEELRRFQAEGMLVRENGPSVYVYRLIMGEHEQHGIVACCRIDDYQKGVIRKHEHTREDKLQDRINLLKTVNANTGLVFMTYRDRDEITALISEEEKAAPLFDFVGHFEVRHTIWKVHRPEPMQRGFRDVPACYIADGHHRAAAAVRVGKERRAAGGDAEKESDWFMGALFPSSQLLVLPYNRTVSDLHGMSSDEFLNAVRERFEVTEDAPPEPGSAGRVAMYLAGKWFGLSWSPAGDDPVASLDVSVLQDRLLGPILGIGDPRVDERIDFVGGIHGVAELKNRVDCGRAAVAFSMHPVTVEDMISVADAGRIMPPKSTWFEPKLKSGLVVHTL